MIIDYDKNPRLSIEQQLQSLRDSVQQALGEGESAWQQTEDRFTSRLVDAEGNISTLEQTARSITARLYDPETGDITILRATASSLVSQMGNAEGNISRIDQTVNRISGRVSSIEEDYVTSSALTLTADSITSSVAQTYQTISGMSSYVTGTTLTQTVNGLDTRITSAQNTADGEVSTRTMLIRAKDGGVITAYEGQTYGVYTNATNSAVDIVTLSWSGTSPGKTPSVTSTIARYGASARIGLESSYNTLISSGGIQFRSGTSSIGAIGSSSSGLTWPAANTTLTIAARKLNIDVGSSAGSSGEWYTFERSACQIPCYTSITSGLYVENTIYTEKGNVNAEAGRFVSLKTYTDPGGAGSSTVSTQVIYVNSNGTFLMGSINSISRVKNSIERISDSELDPHKLYDIGVYQYKYNKDYLGNEKDCRYDKLLCGFIAEDVQEKYPVAADVSDEGELKGWNPRYLIPPMLALIQEQHKEIEELKRRLS